MKIIVSLEYFIYRYPKQNRKIIKHFSYLSILNNSSLDDRISKDSSSEKFVLRVEFYARHFTIQTQIGHKDVNSKDFSLVSVHLPNNY